MIWTLFLYSLFDQDEELHEDVKKILEGANLEEVTMKTVIKQVSVNIISAVSFNSPQVIDRKKIYIAPPPASLTLQAWPPWCYLILQSMSLPVTCWSNTCCTMICFTDAMACVHQALPSLRRLLLHGSGNCGEACYMSLPCVTTW